jgi:hypothetical protein
MSFWSAGACSRFCGVSEAGQNKTWEARFPFQKRRRATALQNVGTPMCRRAVEIVGAPTEIRPVAQAVSPAAFLHRGVIAIEEKNLTLERVSYKVVA